MKSVFEMKGVERAAALLIALGPSIAADILKFLDEDSIERLTVEMSKIDRLDPAEKEDLIGEFMIDLRRESRRISGGENKAKELLTDAFGSDRADDIMKKFSARDLVREFDFLKEASDDILVSFLKDENPQMLAVTLSFLTPQKSAAVLKAMSQENAKDVALRMAKMKKINPEAVSKMAVSLKEKYRKYLASVHGVSSGGMDSLINILQHMEGDAERGLLSNLEKTMPDVSEKIKDAIFTFENLVNLSNRETRILIDEINDDMIIAKALKGGGDDIRFKFMRNMSQNRATDILNDMKAMGPVHISDVEYCRSRITAVARMLHDNGLISIKKSDDQIVE
ncbi:MAG: flagellar motor switch protein FliG [Spirochaetes bacterium]|jgi:flagellar motor switch protein FliG|nr:flagellar motor switch protein FliG [Spirochaetota bacterium]